MRRRVGQLFALVVSRCDDLVALHNDGTDRYFVFDRCLLPEFYRAPHEVFGRERKQILVAIFSQDLLP